MFQNNVYVMEYVIHGSKNHMEYIVHGSKNQNDSKLKLTLQRVC